MTIEQAINLFSPKPWLTPGTLTEEAFSLALEALKQARWIPCSERMPKVCKDTSYLAYIPSFGAVDIADYHPDVDDWTFMGMPITVSHWMPLPEPPEEEQNGRT